MQILNVTLYKSHLFRPITMSNSLAPTNIPTENAYGQACMLQVGRISINIDTSMLNMNALTKNVHTRCGFPVESKYK